MRKRKTRAPESVMERRAGANETGEGGWKVNRNNPTQRKGKEKRKTKTR